MKYDTPPFPLSKILFDVGENIPVPTTEIPSTNKSEFSILKRLKELNKNLKKVIHGQDKAIEIVENLLKISYAGLQDNNRPQAIMLFTGPTGVGKTELARQLAKQLHRRLIRLDMSEYQERVSITRLIGAAPGYIGHEDGGQLVLTIQESSSCVLLLDEIEKCHPDVLKIFLQVFDHATLTSSRLGIEANFQDTIIIMTSNVGAGKKNGNIGFVEKVSDNDHLNSELRKYFIPEFLNRIDAIIPFNHLSQENILEIVRKEIKNLKIKLQRKHIDLSVTEECVKNLAVEGFSAEFGAREIKRLISKKILSLLVNEILFGMLSHCGSINIDWKTDIGYFIQIKKEGTENLWL